MENRKWMKSALALAGAVVVFALSACGAGTAEEPGGAGSGSGMDSAADSVTDSAAEPAAGASGTSGREPVRRGPAYVYYMKNGSLMRADVWGETEEGRNPRIISEAIGGAITIKSYGRAVRAGDGSFTAFQIDVSDGENFWDMDEALIVVESARGEPKELCRGYSVMQVHGNVLYYLAREEAEPEEEIFGRVDLYRYCSEQGKELLAGDVDVFSVLKDGTVVFTRMRDDGGKDLYRLDDSGEMLLGEEMYYTGYEAPDSGIYAARSVSDEEEGSYSELVKIGGDGSCRTVISGDLKASTIYVDEKDGSVYYIRFLEEASEENGWNAVRALCYVDSGGQETCLTDDLREVRDYVRMDGAKNPYGGNVILYTEGAAGEPGLYAAVQGRKYKLELPEQEEEWMREAVITGTRVTGGNICVIFRKWKDGSGMEGGKLCRLNIDGEETGELLLEADGFDVTPQKAKGAGASEKLFYSDSAAAGQGGPDGQAGSPDGQGGGPDSVTLCCEGREILRDYVRESLMAAGENGEEYFALREKKGARGDAGAQAADLMRITAEGSSKIMREDVALCEPWEGGLLMLADCEKEYPYRGSLYFCDGQEMRKLDEGVSVFFAHDSGSVAEGIPYAWDCLGLRQDEKDND